MSYTAAKNGNAAAPPRFVRRTTLGAGEYRKNFRQIDAEVIAAVTSAEAGEVTPLMSKVYLRLVSAPPEFWEREGVLYFTGREAEGRIVKASKVLYELLGVASATAHKALRWMHGQGIIGYFAGKNGAGIRIFINRASGSIGLRADAVGEKILRFPHGSNGEEVGSVDEPAFNDSFAVLETLDTDLNPRAPKGGAKQTEVVTPSTATGQHPHTPDHSQHAACARNGALAQVPLRSEATVEEIVRRLRQELEPSLRSAARQAAALEHERTREWLEGRGLPKAARVAQREAYNVLRKCGVLAQARRPSHADVGRGEYTAPEPHTLAHEEVEELAQVCVALLEAKGQPVEVTLSEMRASGGGFLLPEDEPRVRRKLKELTGG